MKRARCQFLAGSAFTRNQNRDIGRGHLPYFLKDGLHYRAFPDQIFQTGFRLNLGSKRDILLQPECFFNNETKLFDTERFGQEVIRSQAAGFYGIIHGSVGRDQNEDDVFILVPDFTKHFHAVHSRHSKI